MFQLETNYTIDELRITKSGISLRYLITVNTITFHVFNLPFVFGSMSLLFINEVDSI